MTLQSQRGSTPPGTSNERQAAKYVQGMFAQVAPKYDLLNRVLSFNVDRGWRKALTKKLAAVLGHPEACVLDLCCGTGDVLLELQSSARATVMGADFCHPMLVSAQAKVQQLGWRCPLFEADALSLPLCDSALDAVTIAFGFRNLTNYEAGLAELHRVLKPGGILTILEFSHPPGWLIKTAYGFYSRTILPAIGRMISGSPDAYTYLPNSIRAFPTADALAQMMARAGFSETGFQLLTGGIAAVHVGTK